MLENSFLFPIQWHENIKYLIISEVINDKIKRVRTQKSFFT